MNILADECIDRQIVERLRVEGYDVLYVAELDPGIPDDVVLNQANERNAMLLTADKDFGEMVYRSQMAHRGIVLMRLDDERSANKIAVLAQLLQSYGDRLPDAFVVVSEDRIRFAQA